MKRLLQNDFHLLDDVRGGVERLEVLEGPTGRRSWSDREKVRIVLESFEPGARVCDVARRNGLTPQHLSTWRGLARKGKLPMPLPDEDSPTFAAVAVAPEEIAAAGDDRIEICAEGVTVRLPGRTSAARIAEIAAALRSG